MQLTLFHTSGPTSFGEATLSHQPGISFCTTLIVRTSYPTHTFSDLASRTDINNVACFTALLGRHVDKKPSGGSAELEAHFGCPTRELVMVGDR